jgi:hypothetical protein
MALHRSDPNVHHFFIHFSRLSSLLLSYATGENFNLNSLRNVGEKISKKHITKLGLVRTQSVLVRINHPIYHIN